MDGKHTEGLGLEGRGAWPRPEEIRRHYARAREMRAEATAQMIWAAARNGVRATRALAAHLARWRQRRATRAALMACSDRILADVGIERELIPLIARGVDPRVHVARGVQLRRRWAAGLALWRERQRIIRELMAYSDRELDELGVRRRDIPDLARAAVAG